MLYPGKMAIVSTICWCMFVPTFPLINTTVMIIPPFFKLLMKPWNTQITKRLKNTHYVNLFLCVAVDWNAWWRESQWRMLSFVRPLRISPTKMSCKFILLMLLLWKRCLPLSTFVSKKICCDDIHVISYLLIFFNHQIFRLSQPWPGVTKWSDVRRGGAKTCIWTNWVL